MKNIKLFVATMVAFISLTACNNNDNDLPEVLITSISSNTANIGDIVTLYGQNIDATEAYVVQFNGLEGTVTETTTSYIKVTVPERAVSGEITLIDNGKIVSAGFITIVNIFTGDVLLLTQQEVEDFGVNNYSAIEGRLYIGSDSNPAPESITSMASLSALTSVSSSLRIRNNTALTNIDGLNNIKEAGNVLLEHNTALTNVDGLSSLTTTSGFYIIGNPVLSNLEGFSNLTAVGHLSIDENASLTTLNGLHNLTTLNETLEISRTALTNIDALSNITTLGYDLIITSNQFLTSLNGLSNLTSVGENIEISNNTILTNIDGLVGLTTVGGDMYVYNNPALTNVDGFSNLTQLGTLDIYVNVLLSNFCGLNTLIIDNGFTNMTVSQCAYNPTEQDIIDGNCSQ
ncbi:hypothetical protein [Lutibacter sp.]